MQNSQHSYNKNYNIIQKKYHKSSLHLARHAGQFETLENISKREREKWKFWHFEVWAVQKYKTCRFRQELSNEYWFVKEERKKERKQKK